QVDQVLRVAHAEVLLGERCTGRWRSEHEDECERGEATRDEDGGVAKQTTHRGVLPVEPRLATADGKCRRAPLPRWATGDPARASARRSGSPAPARTCTARS